MPVLTRLQLYAIGAVGLVAALLLWLHFHDRGVIDRHEAKIEARVTAATQAANDTANANDTRRQVEDAKAAVLTEEAIRHAEAEHPAEARAPAGPAARAAVDSLRRRAAPTGAPTR
jgi:hypothetical protein